MGRWPWSNRSIVEECLILDTAWLNKHGYFYGFKSGVIEWKNSRGDVKSSIGLIVVTDSLDSEQNYVKLNWVDRLLVNPQELLMKLESKKNSSLAVKAAAKYLNWD